MHAAIRARFRAPPSNPMPEVHPRLHGSTATVAMTNALPSSFGLLVTKEQVSYHVSFGQRPFKPWAVPCDSYFDCAATVVRIATGSSRDVRSMLLGPCYVCGLDNPCREILQVP